MELPLKNDDFLLKDGNCFAIGDTALAQWLVLLPPRTDPIPPATAIGGIEDAEVQQYAHELYVRRPSVIDGILLELRSHADQPSEGSAVPLSFEALCLREKEGNCGICQENFAMDGKTADAPQKRVAGLCKHDYCSNCWQVPRNLPNLQISPVMFMTLTDLRRLASTGRQSRSVRIRRLSTSRARPVVATSSVSCRRSRIRGAWKRPR